MKNTTGGTAVYDGKGNSIATGDNGVMPIAIATVAVAALGVAFVATKKKSSEE